MKSVFIFIAGAFCMLVGMDVFRSPSSQLIPAEEPAPDNLTYFTDLIEPSSEYEYMIWLLFPLEYCSSCWLADDQFIELIYELEERKIGIGLIVSPDHTYNIRSLISHDVSIEKKIDPAVQQSIFYVYADASGNIIHLFENDHTSDESAAANLRMVHMLAVLQGSSG